MSAKVLIELGRRLRSRREALGLTLADLAARTGVSRRYLTDAEAGRANLSVLKLASLAGALRYGLGELCDIPLSRPPRRIALVGLRGAGKSTIGRALAQQLEVPFVELDRLVEESAGLSLAEIFDLHGEFHYRDLEREALEGWLTRSGEGVLATGGSLVTHEESWGRLRETCVTVWLRATAEEHWDRVVAQGDLRPMRRPQAMDELRERLRVREPLYRRAELTIDTSAVDIAAAVRQVTDHVA